MTPSVNFGPVDTSSLVRALNLVATVSSRAMPALLEAAGFDVAVSAQHLTPYVEIATIDAEMAEEVTVGKSGTNQMTRGQALILARMSPNSRYNQMTDSRWAIQRPSLSAAKFARAYGDPGMAKRVFWEFVQAADERQLAGKHSSTHFLQKGWGDVAKKMRANYRARQAGVIDIQAEEVGATAPQQGNTDLGRVTRGATPTSAWIQLENLIGTGAEYPNLSAERNRALHYHGQPALDMAVEQVASSRMNRYLDKVAEAQTRAWNTAN